MKPKKRTHLDICVCHEIQIHYKRPLYNTTQKVSSSESAEILLRAFADDHRLDYKEFFWVMLLTNANHLIAISEVSIGCTNGAMVNIKEVLQLALLTNTSGVIIAHNHPSGELKQSTADNTLTQGIKEALETLDMKLLDHIILTTESYTSFADEDWL